MATNMMALGAMLEKSSTVVDPEMIRKAQLRVCESSRDTADAGLLLAALGINPKRLRINRVPA